jgi:Tfp pilus assembly PilM family ATPase
MDKTKYEKKPWYPNVRETETLIWERFLAKYPDAYDEVAYNVKVGEGSEIPEDTDVNLAKGFKELTQHKIDVVGFKGNAIDIIELKSYAGTRAIGQVIGYRDLYAHSVDPVASPNLVIITDTLRPDTKIIAEKQGIKIIVV